jgi:hypothetical protein
MVRVFVAVLALTLAGVSVARAADAPSDAYLSGYAAAVLEREFQARSASLRVEGGVITIDAADVRGIDRSRLRATLSKIRGVTRVDIREAPAPAAPPVTVDVGTPAPVSTITPFPTEHLFTPLIADPRWPHFAASYEYYLRDPQLGSVAAVSFGETIPFIGQRLPYGAWQSGLQAAVFALFDLDAPSMDLVNADYLIAPFASYRYEPFSAIFRIFHQSSHLGDEFLLRNRVKNRVNLSYEAVDLRLSYELFDQTLRLYGGGGYIFDRDPSSLKPGFVQYGLELRPWRTKPVRPIAAVDLQNREENNWEVDFSARAGVEFENVIASRSLQILLEYFRGHSPNGQFYREKIDYIGLGAHFNF